MIAFDGSHFYKKTAPAHLVRNCKLWLVVIVLTHSASPVLYHPIASLLKPLPLLLGNASAAKYETSQRRERKTSR